MASESDSAVVSPNPYVSRLNEYSEVALAGDRLSLYQGCWRNFFKTRMGSEPARVVLEVGCSNGTFLSEIAKEHSKDSFIGLDWKYKLVYKACEKSAKLGVFNSAFTRAKAQEVEKVFCPGELDEVWLFFPDPWPKAAQQKHRLFQEPFLKSMSLLLKPAGDLFIKTDHPGYFEWMLAVLGKTFDQQAVIQGEAESSDKRSRHGRQVLHRSFGNKELPEASKFASDHFEVMAVSYDFWVDRETSLSGALKPPAFWERTTLFERLFQKDKLPVFYLHLRKR